MTNQGKRPRIGAGRKVGRLKRRLRGIKDDIQEACPSVGGTEGSTAHPDGGPVASVGKPSPGIDSSGGRNRDAGSGGQGRYRDLVRLPNRIEFQRSSWPTAHDPRLHSAGRQRHGRTGDVADRRSSRTKLCTTSDRVKKTEWMIGSSMEASLPCSRRQKKDYPGTKSEIRQSPRPILPDIIL